MCICCNPNAEADQCPTFVTPSGGKSDCIGRTCGPVSYVCPITQLVLCGRDPKYDQENVDYHYDDDADKTMCCKCAVFAVVCLPLFIALDVGLSVPPFFQAEAYKEECCKCCSGQAKSTPALKAPTPANMQQTAAEQAGSV